MTRARLPGEWEPQKSTWLAWPHNVDNWGDKLEEIRIFYVELITLVSQYQEVNLIVKPEDLNELQHLTHLVNLHPIPTNTLWIRDYAPFFLSDNTLVEFTFNSWGDKFPPFELDNQVPLQIAQSLNLHLSSQSEIFEGGSIEVNGQGIGLTTHECLYNTNRNTHQESLTLIENLKSHLGLDQLLILPHGLIGDHTDGHIDNVARFISANELLLVMPQDKNDPNYSRMRTNKEYLEDKFDNKLNDTVEIIDFPALAPIPQGNETLPVSYANFIFVNGAIILPDYGDQASLEEAKEILQQRLPNTEILSINCELLIQEGGSLHCASKNQ